MELIIAINKETSIDQITITDNDICMWREVTKIIEDGEVLTQTYTRGSINKGDDLSSFDQKIQSICNAAWA